MTASPFLKRLHSLSVQLIATLFPPSCPVCQRITPQDHLLCFDCHAALPPMPANYCLRCGRITLQAEQGCGSCLADPHSLDATYFAFQYDELIRDLIIGFKFSDHSERSVLLGRLCWERLDTTLTWEESELIIPMPLHAKRLIQRRYNQSALLAKELAWYLHRPLVTNALIRDKVTTPQTYLNAQARLKNVRGAFRVKADWVRGRSVLLVDDVFTTGATMSEAAATLKKAGASRVVGVCLALVEPDRRDSSQND